jgi:hypothetical protein
VPHLGFGGGLAPSPHLFFLFPLFAETAHFVGLDFRNFPSFLAFSSVLSFSKNVFFFSSAVFFFLVDGACQGGSIAMSRGGVSARLGGPARALARF